MSWYLLKILPKDCINIINKYININTHANFLKNIKYPGLILYILKNIYCVNEKIINMLKGWLGVHLPRSRIINESLKRYKIKSESLKLYINTIEDIEKELLKFGGSLKYDNISYNTGFNNALNNIRKRKHINEYDSFKLVLIIYVQRLYRYNKKKNLFRY